MIAVGVAINATKYIVPLASIDSIDSSVFRGKKGVIHHFTEVLTFWWFYIWERGIKRGRKGFSIFYIFLERGGINLFLFSAVNIDAVGDTYLSNQLVLRDNTGMYAAAIKIPHELFLPYLNTIIFARSKDWLRIYKGQYPRLFKLDKKKWLLILRQTGDNTI